MKGRCGGIMGEEKKTLVHRDGKTYYSKEAERKFFFFVTILMLLAGIFAKTGLF